MVIETKTKKITKESNKKNGPFEKFYKRRNSGLLKEKGNYKNGNLDGTWQDYYENGQVRTRGNYLEGIPFGLWEYFTEEGLLERKTTYNKKGSEEGYFENYHMNGKIKSRGFYKNQQYDGLWELFYQNGQISQRGNFKDGEKVGQWEYFHESGVSLDPDYYFSYQMEKSSDEQEYTPENNDALETEMNFVVVASYYVFHADNEFPDPKWGSKQRKRASFIKELDAWRELCGEERANKFQREYVQSGMNDKGLPTFEEFNFLENRLIESANLFEKLNNYLFPANIGTCSDSKLNIKIKTDETMKYFAIQKIMDITKSSGFISDLEMAALYEVGALIGLNQNFIDEILKSIEND
jgi:antitoxin component YwqK of YwqJK toxin-antitoxin module